MELVLPTGPRSARGLPGISTSKTENFYDKGASSLSNKEWDLTWDHGPLALGKLGYFKIKNR